MVLQCGIILGNWLPRRSLCDMVEIKPIGAEHLDSVKSLADANRDSLGFVPLKKVEEVVEQQRGIVALQDEAVIGFVFYRHRKIDLQTTLSDICVQTMHRGKQVGSMLLDALIRDCEQQHREFIQLKCPVDLPANGFYRRLDFTLHKIEDGKKRQLNVWRFAISSSASE